MHQHIKVVQLDYPTTKGCLESNDNVSTYKERPTSLSNNLRHI